VRTWACDFSGCCGSSGSPGFASSLLCYLASSHPPLAESHPSPCLVQDTLVKSVKYGPAENDPTGKSPGRFPDPSVQPLLEKYSDFQKYQISPIWSPSRAHKRGASRSSRTLGAGCGGRGSAGDEWHRRGRRSRVVLTPRRWRQVCENKFSRMTVTKKPDRRGELEVSRKPLRREGRTASAEPVCSCAFSFTHFARETAGAARTRSSLRPLTSEGGTYPQNSRDMRGEIAKLCFVPHARTE
jgi:hypothetical protein